MKTQLLRNLPKLGGAIALSLSLALTACNPEPEAEVVDNIGSVDADVDVPTDQAAVPSDAEVGGDNAADDLGSLIGETVTISTKVTEVISPNMFTAFDEESMRGEEILILTETATLAVDDNVEVTGEVMTFDEAAINEAYSVTLDPKVVEAYTGKPYIAAKALEPVD